jgi:predicted GNAT family N-acyltransferase
MQVCILKANHTDLETILQLQKDCYMAEAEIYNDYTIPPLKQDLKSLENEFANSTILKSIINGELVGSIRGFSNNKTAFIGKLIVKKDLQNSGIGQQLLSAMESVFMDCTRFELFTGFRSQKNLYLYHKHGYREFKQQKVNDTLTLIFLEKIKVDTQINN